jgi:putative FmdB family regulatory protein
MPLYEFSCANCGLEFSPRKKISERNTGTVCPRCGKSLGVTRKTVYSVAITQPNSVTRWSAPARRPNVTIRDVSITNFKTGLNVESGSASLDNVEIQNTETAIKSKNADISARKLKIK